jgi:hypothetical protein
MQSISITNIKLFIKFIEFKLSTGLSGSFLNVQTLAASIKTAE